LAEAAGGRLLRSSSRPIATAFIDSRAPIRDGLFVPIVAARDGHDFVDAAIRGGASAVLLQTGRSVPAGDLTVVEVEDTLAGLSSLGRHARDTVTGPVVAVTGSNGKTTTRAMVQAALETTYPNVLCTRGNLNNHLGVPLTLVGEPHQPAAAVIEMGMSAPGEVDHLAGIVRPDVAVITSIALEHVESMGTLEAIARAEFEVAAHLPEGGALVLPSDEPRLHALVDDALRERCGILTFGPDEDADVRVLGVEVGAPTVARLEVEGTSLTVRLQTFGAHNARNAAAAVCVGKHLGLDLAAVAAGLERVEPVGDRGRAIAWGEHLIVADCYNANPGSMEAAVRSLAMLRAHRPGPLIAVLGDMLELGPDTVQLHTEVGELVADAGLDAVLGFGPLSEHIAAGAVARDIDADHVVDDVAAAAAWVRARLEGKPPGAVLFKASRGIRLERVIEALTA
jgi:UDP-N-acetylmuramoyl-tripeptide--D-alanyl-D-alanine ligase